MVKKALLKQTIDPEHVLAIIRLSKHVFRGDRKCLVN